MTSIDQSPFVWLEFDKDGNLSDATVIATLRQSLDGSGASDLVVMSHGWKTDQADAWDLYEPLWTNVTQSLAGAIDPKKIVVAGVSWPSKAFQTDFDAASVSPVVAQTLDVKPDPSDGDLPEDLLRALLDDYAAFTGRQDVKQAALAIMGGYDDVSAAVFLAALKGSVSAPASPDLELAGDLASLSQKPSDVLLSLTTPPTNMKIANGAGAPLGLGQVLNGVLQGPRAAIGRALNQFTYFEMKTRAGTVGTALGAKLLPQIPPTSPTRLHLIGHSFGARLVTAAADALSPAANTTLSSLTLLEGAFSQNALSSSFSGGSKGAFATILSDAKVSGPITISHTHNDSACTIAYALASRLSRDTTQALGDANDIFGAMGGNGAQNIPNYAPASLTMAKGTATYNIDKKHVNNVLADACIKDHMDVTNSDVGALVASAIRP
jgi:hypothetical protein